MRNSPAWRSVGQGGPDLDQLTRLIADCPSESKNKSFLPHRHHAGTSRA
jgi:hypothetical protein